MDVSRSRQHFRCYFHHGPNHHELPVGTQTGYVPEQPYIHPLVDDAEEPDPRMRDRGLIGGILL